MASLVGRRIARVGHLSSDQCPPKGRKKVRNFPRQTAMVIETGEIGKHVLAGFDADLGIIDLNHIDKRLQIGLPERH
jgi:5'-3' exonuclease